MKSSLVQFELFNKAALKRFLLCTELLVPQAYTYCKQFLYSLWTPNISGATPATLHFRPPGLERKTVQRGSITSRIAAVNVPARRKNRRRSCGHNSLNYGKRDEIPAWCAPRAKDTTPTTKLQASTQERTADPSGI